MRYLFERDLSSVAYDDVQGALFLIPLRNKQRKDEHEQKLV